jgi:hypothetical protein
MPNTVVSQILNDGPRNYVLSLIIEADGSGDEIQYPIADAALAGCDHFSVKRLDASVSGEFGLRLDFGGTSPATFLHVQAPTVPTTSTDINLDYTRTGGIPDPEMPNYDGTIILTTDGMDSAGDAANVHLWLTKHG